MRKVLTSIVALCATFVLTAAEPPQQPSASIVVKGQTRPQMLNVRISPAANAGVVDKLKRGTEVEIVGEEGSWFKIKLPKSADSYLSSEYIKDGKTITRVQLRYGPGINYQSYGVVPSGTAVKVVSTKHPQWTQITPPDGFYAYVNSAYVAVSDDDYKKINGNSNAVPPYKRNQEELPKVNPASATDMAKSFERMRAFFNSEPEDVTLSGEILKTDSAATGAAYALVTRENSKLVTLAVLYTGKVDWSKWSDHNTQAATGENGVDLSKYISKKITITGKKLSVPGWSYPYIVVESVK